MNSKCVKGYYYGSAYMDSPFYKYGNTFTDYFLANGVGDSLTNRCGVF